MVLTFCSFRTYWLVLRPTRTSRVARHTDCLAKGCHGARGVGLKISQKIVLTDDIATADAERDGLYSGYKKAVNGFKNLPVENMAKAAKVQGIWSYYKPPHITHIFCNFGVTEG